MLDTKNIKIEDFDYLLPDEKIPRYPLKERDSCKLLVRHEDGVILHNKFSELPMLIPSNSLLVCNDTRVINARISFKKSTGSRIEVFLLEPLSPKDYVLMFQSKRVCRWGCLVGNLKRWKSGELTKMIRVGGKETELRATRLTPLHGNMHEIQFEWNDPEMTFATVVENAGYIPIPPYLKRDSEDSDAEDYQTVFADVRGSVAAPTAGLHFTPELFDSLRGKGVEIAHLTLHVGAGTFQPVKSETIGEHPMHTEVFTVSKTTLRLLIEAKRSGKPILAVGTTSVRTLESLPYIGKLLEKGEGNLEVAQWCPYGEDAESISDDTVAMLEQILHYMESRGVDNLTASTSIMIAPGFCWKMVDIMITNFHQPQSTLLLLVSSFLDRKCSKQGGAWKEVYREALEKDYRFLSYGDACLFFGG